MFTILLSEILDLLSALEEGYKDFRYCKLFSAHSKLVSPSVGTSCSITNQRTSHSSQAAKISGKFCTPAPK